MAQEGSYSAMSGRTDLAAKPSSRVGRRPVIIPGGVEVQLRPGEIAVKGPRGTVIQALHPNVEVRVENDSVVVSPIGEEQLHRALHGLVRSLIANAVVGVSQGYERSLELRGVGYRVQQAGKGIVLNVGYSHPVEFHPMEGVTLVVEGNNRIHVRGADKQRVGETAARIRRIRPPNPYKDKGIRYVGETLRFKPGKAAVKTTQ